MPKAIYKAPHPWKMLRFVNKKALFHTIQEFFFFVLSKPNKTLIHTHTKPNFFHYHNKNQLSNKSIKLTTTTHMQSFAKSHITYINKRRQAKYKRRRRNDLSFESSVTGWWSLEFKTDSSCHVVRNSALNRGQRNCTLQTDPTNQRCRCWR